MVMWFRPRGRNREFNISSARSSTQHALSLEEHREAMDSKSRMCYKVEEHVKHTVAWCTTLAPSEHTNRHNKVAGYIHWKICQHTGLQVTDRYCDHMDILWTCTWKGHKREQYHYYVGRTGYRRLTVLANWSDIILNGRKRRLACWLI